MTREEMINRKLRKANMYLRQSQEIRNRYAKNDLIRHAYLLIEQAKEMQQTLCKKERALK
ncbi:MULTISPECIES: hypothetical protein [unclassified Psychrobacillus]|uniref:hypothetical protein n=1 Tax=unclassified Psychrobacillus TaxID=2636677 RepID=UPI0030FBF067